MHPMNSGNRRLRQFTALKMLLLRRHTVEKIKVGSDWKEKKDRRKGKKINRKKILANGAQIGGVPSYSDGVDTSSLPMEKL